MLNGHPFIYSHCGKRSAEFVRMNPVDSHAFPNPFQSTLNSINLQSGMRISKRYKQSRMQACFCDVCFTPLALGCPSAVGCLCVAMHMAGWRGHQALAPNAQDLCMDCQYTGHTSAYDRTRGMTITVESFVLMIPMVQSKAFPIVLTMESQW